MNISVIGLWRNSSKHIQRTLDSLENLATLGNFDFYFYENDSADDTSRVLSDWLKNKSGNLLSENIGAPQFGSVPNIERLILLSYYRNKAKTLIHEAHSRYTLLIDTDIIFNNSHFLDLYDFMLQNPNCSMSVANTRQHQIADLMNEETDDSFYDVFAIRDQFNNNGLYFTDCPFLLDSDRNLWKQNLPICIQSGFGGFALIKTEILKKQESLWSTCGHSEHVNFCSSISKHGPILLVPSCKTKTDIDLSTINIEACRSIAKEQLNKIAQINYIYNLSTSQQLNIK